MLNDISFDLNEILSGTTDHTHPRYLSEAAKPQDPEKEIKKFVDKVNSLMGTLKKKPEGEKIVNSDSKLIFDSQGKFTKIKKGKVNKNISFVIDHFKSIQSDSALLKANKLNKLKDTFNKISLIKDKLVEWEPLYHRGFELKIDLIRTEYEVFTLTLIMFVSALLVNSTYFLHEYQKINPETEKKSDSTETQQNQEVKTPTGFFGKLFANIGNFIGTHHQKWTLSRTIDNIYKELLKPVHKEYLETLIKLTEQKQTPTTDVKTESVFTEGFMSDLFNLPGLLSQAWQLGAKVFTTVKNCVYSIIPLLRISNYMKHEKRISSIQVLEDEIEFLEKNIKLLEKSSELPEAKKASVIKKQTELMERHKRTIAKIKAEYDITDSDATKSIKQSDQELQQRPKPSQSDDLTL